MQTFWTLLWLCVALGAAQIDPKLYEGSDTEAYYREIEQRIAQEPGQSPEARQEERAQLERLRQAASRDSAIEPIPTDALSAHAISPDRYDKVVHALAALRADIDRQKEFLDEARSRLAYLKNGIESLSADEKPQLLSLQLRFAYYKLRQKSIEERLAKLSEHDATVFKALAGALSHVECAGTVTLDDRLAANADTLEAARKLKVAREIDLEQSAIDEKAKLAPLRDRLEQAEAARQNALSERADLLGRKALCLLRLGHDREAYAALDALEQTASQLGTQTRPLYRAQLSILRALAKSFIGSTRSLLGWSVQELFDALSHVSEMLSAPLFVFNEQPISFLSLLRAIGIVILGIFAGVMYKRWLLRMSARWSDMSRMSLRIASNIGYYLLVFSGVMIAVASLGIDLTSLSLIAGALSIGIGFGLQTVVSNLIAGIILMVERTIRIGDVIELNDMLRGTVTDMRIRSTTINTFDNIDIVVPNSSFIQNNVINWTLDDPTRRLHIPFGVAYGTEVAAVQRAVLDELANTELRYIKDDEEKAPQVWMVAMNSSSVDFELLVWVRAGDKLRPNALKSDFLILVYEALNKHGIPIPFPQLDLHVKELPERDA